MFFAEPECGSTLASSGAHQPGLGRHLRGFIPIEDLFGDGPGLTERGDRREEVIGAQVLALEHAAAAEDVPFGRRAGPIEAASERSSSSRMVMLWPRILVSRMRNAAAASE